MFEDIKVVIRNSKSMKGKRIMTKQTTKLQSNTHKSKDCAIPTSLQIGGELV